MNFSEMRLRHEILKALDEMGFVKPTPIQESSIPLLLQGSDLIGQARTGTGKTAAFCIPILQALVEDNNSHKGVFALVLVPTRELAVQVCREFNKVGKHVQFSAIAVYGGVDLERQVHDLRNAKIVVGTPGRIIDHLKRGTLDLSKLSIAVLDEADRMLDMGFIEDVEFILQKSRRERQMALFSATMPSEIIQLANKHMNSPEKIKESEDEFTVKEIKQYYLSIDPKDRLNAMALLFKHKTPAMTIVFCRTKLGADKLSHYLKLFGINALALHGNLTQARRERTLQDFRNGRIQVLVATDLAARGLDIQGVSHVINYNIPEDEKTYVHRIGRTGRMGKDGEAITLVTNLEEQKTIQKIASMNGANIEKMEMQITHVPFTKRIPFPERMERREQRGGFQRRPPGRPFRPGGFAPRRQQGGNPYDKGTYNKHYA